MICVLMSVSVCSYLPDFAQIPSAFERLSITISQVQYFLYLKSFFFFFLPTCLPQSEWIISSFCYLCTQWITPYISLTVWNYSENRFSTCLAHQLSKHITGEKWKRWCLLHLKNVRYHILSTFIFTFWNILINLTLDYML